jgi:hypothetical protein
MRRRTEVLKVRTCWLANAACVQTSNFRTVQHMLWHVLIIVGPCAAYRGHLQVEINRAIFLLLGSRRVDLYQRPGMLRCNRRRQECRTHARLH